jgi:cell division septation protein DedD
MRSHATSIRRLLTTLAAALCCFAEPADAQAGAAVQAPPPLPANDSIFRRARRLVSEGNGAAGRALVDSMVRVSSEGTPDYGNAIFWRGALAETAAEAERDYRRVIVEYPLSPYTDDALLSLAELEQARGDRTGAFQHLQRFVREHPMGPARARAGLAAARLAFEQRDATRGCAMIADARASAGASDVELRNQIDYYGARCPTTSAVASTGTAPTASPPVPTPSAAPIPTAPATRPAERAATPPSTAAATPARETTAARPTPSTREEPARPAPTPRDSEPTRAATTSPSAPRGTWTIQLAAYNTRPDAERLVAKLAGRGVKARISGTAKPFRVRLDYYQTRQAAAAAVAALKERGIIGFVTEEPAPSGVSSP